MPYVFILVAVLIGCAGHSPIPPGELTAGSVYRLRATSKPMGIPDVNLRPGPDTRFHLGFDAVFAAPNAGLGTPEKIILTAVPVVGGGRLGTSKLISPSATKNKFVVFLPPLDEFGEVIYLPSLWATMLAPYADAKGIGVVSLDETPRALVDALAVGDPVDPQPTTKSLPPVVIFSRGPAQALFQYHIHLNELPGAGGVGLHFSATAVWELKR